MRKSIILFIVFCMIYQFGASQKKYSDSKNQLVLLEADYQIEEKSSELLRQEGELIRQKSQPNTLFVVVLAAILLLTALGLFYNRISKKNKLLGIKNSKINEQKIALEDALKNLKRLQSHLIHSEKLACLGELTTGFAQEIQHPLNYVRIISEKNGELIEALKEELKQGNIENATEIISDLGQNDEKIIHYGKRAEGIVRKMLKHSKMSGAEKKLTDINQLIEEYLRLLYHSKPASNSDDQITEDIEFTAIDVQTDLDPNLPKMNVDTQELGKVSLNLIKNALYAVREHEKVNLYEDFDPKVVVKTKLISADSGEEIVEISVSDNGTGIPAQNIDKIFQPFFTTKSAGEGIGLGLSLAYDIIKSQGGKLEVESEENFGTTFRIQISNC